MFSSLWSNNEDRASSPIATGTQEPSKHSSRRRRGPVKIDCADHIECVALLADGEHVVSGGRGKKIWHWKVDDGSKVGMPMDAGSSVCSIAVSQDGRWIVSGTKSGLVQLWNAETSSKEREIPGHRGWVWAVDISADATEIASGSGDDDTEVSVWSLSTGARLLGPWEHPGPVAAAKFSPDGRLVATATWQRNSVRVYDRDSCLLKFDVAIQIGSARNNALAWSSDGIFILSHDGNVHCLDPSAGTALARWAIHGTQDTRCIAVAGNGTFVVASAGRSVSFWDTTTQQQIGSVVQLDNEVHSLVISDDHDLVTCGDKTISIRNLCNILHPSYMLTIEGKIIEKLRRELVDARAAQRTAEEENGMLHEEHAQLEQTIEKLRHDLAQSRHVVDEHRIQSESLRLCQIKACQYEALCAQCRTFDAAKLLVEIEHAAGKYIKDNKFFSDWLTESMSRCSKTLESRGDDASNAGKPGEAATAYAAALALPSSTPDALLAKWASAALTNTVPRKALCAGFKFRVLRFAVYRAICNTLEEDGRISEAVVTFRQMQNDLRDTDACNEQTQWEREFRERWTETLVNLGDTASSNKKHDEAIRYYSDAMLLDPTNLHEVLLKHANELIVVDPSSHEGYEEKHAALHGVGRYSEAFQAVQSMLSILERSRDPKIHKLRHKYIDATSAIRKEVGKAIRHLPTVLIDTDTGCLYSKTQQAAAFEELPIYDELRSSMTTTLDHSRIQKEVTEFYRYVMFSHKWEVDEPTFQRVENDSVYSLPPSLTFDKLRNFCKRVVTLQFKWAWSDTCCVNQLDKGVQQESIVAMFRWYRHSSLTIVHLLGVLSESQEAGCLWRSIWNTRGWTYQEYVASEVVQFYTEDWQPYLGLQIFNHKESPAVLREMERATNVTTQQLIVLQPGLDRAREKLYLASGRETTREEDIAYSLFGIFGVALPVVYGEGNLAVGRLLEHILMRSDEVTLLAWTGHSGNHHSYLPASLMVYNEIIPKHVPAPIDASEMDLMVSVLQPAIDLSLAINLYKCLHDLPSLSLTAGRLKLPGIVFQLGELASPLEFDPQSNIYVYHTKTPLLGNVEIRTVADLSGMRGLRLIHPWISPLVDQDFANHEALFDLDMLALRLLVRLRRPFGGLLLAPVGRSQYKRVATDSLIVSRIREEAPLEQLLEAVQTVNIQ